MNARTTGSLLIIALAIALAIICLCFRSIPTEVVYPVERAKVGLFRGLRTRVKSWLHAQALIGENQRLKREVASLSQTLVDIERVEMENARLRRALDYTAKTPECWIAAEVLSRGGAATGKKKFLRIDKGSQAGIRPGAVVVVPEGLVGRITALTPHTAEVTLITDPSLAVSCEIEADVTPKMRGILSGGENVLALRHLRHVATIPPRTRVLTSGLGGVFPRGLEIGTLLSVSDAAGEVQPSVDFASLEDVFVRREK